MTRRRIVLATCLASVLAGTAGAAHADPGASGAPIQTKNHNICIAIAENDNYNAADYYCITTP